MTDDLEAIDVLSRRFEDEFNNLNRHSSANHAIIHIGEPVWANGENILRMYEAELQKAPNDVDVKNSLARHLYRMGYLQVQAIIPDYLPGASKLGSDYHLGKIMVAHAQNACHYLVRSYQTMQSPLAASLLGTVFSFVRFYGTAIYWYSQAENAGGDRELTNMAKATRLELQSHGPLSDPPLSSRMPFPNSITPGLRMGDDTVLPTSMTAAKTDDITSGCGGKAALLIVVVVTFMQVLSHLH